MPPQPGQPCEKAADGKTPTPSPEEPAFSTHREVNSLGNGLRAAPFPVEAAGNSNFGPSS